MNNKTVLKLCIADVNDLLSKAIRDHVLQNKSYEVGEVSWDSSEDMFRIVLEPKAEASK